MSQVLQSLCLKDLVLVKDSAVQAPEHGYPLAGNHQLLRADVADSAGPPQQEFREGRGG